MIEDSELVYIVLTGTFILIVLVSFIVFSVVMYNRSRGLHNSEMSELKSNMQNEMISAQLEIKEKTLDNISSEIHDNIGQVLSLAKMNLQFIDKKSDAINESMGYITTAIGSLRDLSHLISSNNLETNLEELLQKEVDQLNRTTVIKGELIIEDEEYFDIDPEKSFVMYRIVQESINNIIKHAKADKITLSITKEDNNTIISIVDNGVGFNVREKSKSNGMQNLRKRAIAIDAEMKITSKIGLGTTILVNLQDGESI